jgi:hypothetical protein
MSTGMSILPFDGLAVVVTGNVPGLDRNQATEAVTRLGGKPMGSVSGKTGLVVMGEGAGVSKTAKVRQHGTPVMAAVDFAALAADPSSWDGAPVGVALDALPASAAAASAEVEAVERVPWSQRAHMVGVATAPSLTGAVEYRCWCKCGTRWLGTGGDTLRAGCPADPASRLNATTGDAFELRLVSESLRSAWGGGEWVDHAARLAAQAEADEATLATLRDAAANEPADLLSL